MPKPSVVPAVVEMRLFQPEILDVVQLSDIPSAAQVTAKVTLQDPNALSVAIGLTVFNEEAGLPDPTFDEPPGHHHDAPEPSTVLVAIGQSDGVTPLAVDARQVVKVSLNVTALGDNFNETSGTLLILGDTWDPVTVPVTFTRLGVVENTLAATDLAVRQGQTVSTTVTARCVGGPAVDVSYELVPDGEAEHITLDPLSLRIPPGETQSGVLVFRVDGACTVGLKNLRLRQLGGFSTQLNVHLDVQPAPAVAPSPDIGAIRRRMLAKYDEIGGARSSLGLPIAADMPVNRTGSRFHMDFRGGQLLLDPAAADVITQTQQRVEVWWTGLECQIRQESTDEMYGGIGMMVPAISGFSKTEKFPDDGGGTWDMGPPGLRIIKTDRLLYNGPPMDIVISFSLIEHDSGDTSRAKQAIAEAVAQAAAGLGALVGVPAEALAGSSQFVRDLTLKLSDLVTGALGIDDDQYTPQTLLIRWPEMQGQQFTRQTLRRDDDPHTLDFTHSIIATGIDQGHDIGQYAAYFDVRVFKLTEG